MIVVGFALVLALFAAIALGADDSNAGPWLAAGAVGVLFIIAGIAEAIF